MSHLRKWSLALDAVLAPMRLTRRSIARIFSTKLLTPYLGTPAILLVSGANHGSEESGSLGSRAENGQPTWWRRKEMAHRNIVAMTMLLATLGGAVRATEDVTPVAGVQRVRLQVAGIV